MSTRKTLFEAFVANGLTPDSVAKLADIARELWLNTPNTASFVAWGIFRTLSSHWDDSQAIESSTIDLFQLKLVPKLGEWLKSDKTFLDAMVVSEVLQVMHDCWKS